MTTSLVLAMVLQKVLNLTLPIGSLVVPFWDNLIGL